MTEVSGQGVMEKQKAVTLPDTCKNELDLASAIEQWMDGMKAPEKLRRRAV